MPPEVTVHGDRGDGDLPAQLRPVLRAALDAYQALLDARGWVARGGAHWPAGPPLDREEIDRRAEAHDRAIHAVCVAVRAYDGTLPPWLRGLAASAEVFEPDRRERALGTTRPTLRNDLSGCTAG